jgi:S1-C subfamily serine protease
VKVLPFYGADGALVGGRVTGVRPGSTLARAGLAPGDVIVAVDETRTATLGATGLRCCLQDDVAAIEVERGSGDARRHVQLHP